MIKKRIHQFRTWGASLARHRHAELFLFLVSFAESSFFPLPPDVLLVPMVLANRKKWFRLALITTIASVLGAIIGYVIGLALFDVVAEPLIRFYHLEEHVQIVGGYFESGAFFAVLLSAFTPIPFKIFTIAGGLFKIAFIPFVIAATIGRGARFFLEAYMVHKAGHHIKPHKHPVWYGILGLLIVVAGIAFLMLR